MESNIVNSEAAKFAYEIAGYAHKPVEQVVLTAMRELAQRILPKVENPLAKSDNNLTANIPLDKNIENKSLLERIEDIQKRVAALPVLDDRTAEEIIGYDEHGLPPQ